MRMSLECSLPPSQELVKQAADLGLHLDRWPVGPHEPHAPGVLPGKNQVPGSDAFLKGKTLRLEPSEPGFAARLPGAGAVECEPGVEIEHDRQVRLGRSADNPVESADPRGPKLSAVALIGERSIVESVADDKLTARERRPNDILQKLGARGVHEEELGERRGPGPALGGVAGIHQDAPDPLADDRAARFASGTDVTTKAPQVAHQQSVLRGLSCTVNPLECDECSAFPHTLRVSNR